MPGAALYQSVRDAISVQNFDDSTWPTAMIDQKGVKALATVQPDPDSLVRLSGPELQAARARMWDLVKGMDDLTADVLDAVACLWVEQAVHKDQVVWLTADQFLAFRGLQPHRSSAGRESGYKDQQRRQVADHLVRLENTWIDVVEMEVVEEQRSPDGKVRRRRKKWKGRSRALIRSSEAGQVTISGGLDPYAWRLRPGDVFCEFLLGPGRDVVLLSRKALEYDPYRQEVEKRLARFFAYHWRGTAGGESPRFTVSKLLEAAHKTPSARHPHKTKQRLERALLTLAVDRVITIPGLIEAAERLRPEGSTARTAELVEDLIASGHLAVGDFLYGDGFHDAEVGERGWSERWLRQGVRVEPPPVLLELYASMIRSEQEAPETDEEPASGNSVKRGPRDLIARFIEVREQLGMTLADVAAEIDVTRAYLSMILRRTRKPSREVKERLEAWLERVSGSVS